MLTSSSTAHCVLAVIACANVTGVQEAAAAEAGKRSFSLRPGDAAVTLREFSAAAFTPVVYLVDRVRGVQTNEVRGVFTPREAAERMVAGTELIVSQDPKTGALLIARRPDRETEPAKTPPTASLSSSMKKSSFLALAVGWLFAAAAVDAQQTGAIQGRVRSTALDTYVERARVSLEGAPTETFTDADGYYRFDNLPEGRVILRVFHTGMATATNSVTVVAGQTVQHDVALEPLGSRAASGEVVRLDQFVVSTSREMSGAAIAINEQRFADNIRNVISSDEFGGVAEGNTVEVLKFLPGITVDTGASVNNRYISINGVSPENVPVTLDGFGLASIATAGTGRAVQVDMISINNLSRIEVSYSPTPDSKGAALAGSVNMVPRSAFERSKPLFTGSVYLTMRDNARDFNRVPGPLREAASNVHSGFDFSYVAPVNKRFGYTVSGGNSAQFAQQDNVTLNWRGAGSETNGTTFPDTTPNKPYLAGFTVLDGPSLTRRASFGLTFDYRITERDRLSLGFQWSSFDVLIRNNSLAFSVGRVGAGDFSSLYTHGAVGAGTVDMTRGERNRLNRTYMPTLVWRHSGPIWKADAGLGLSRARDENFGSRKGFFRNSVASRTGVTVWFDDNTYLRPGSITIRDGSTGATVDPYRLQSYVLASANDNQDSSVDTVRSAYVNLRRDFTGSLPLSIKGGLDFSQSIRDLRGSNPTLTFVGADGRPGTADDSPVPYRDPVNSGQAPGYGFPPTEMVSTWLLLEEYRRNPRYFTSNPNAEYRAEVTASRYASEIISAAYLRGDLALMDRRLKLIGGLRAEQTNIEGEGPLTDPTGNFQRNAAGEIILGPNGRPLTILPASDALGVSRLTYLERQRKTDKEYLRYFPSLNASYQVSENLIARAAYYHSIGRPNFNQYSGPLTLPDTTLPPGQNNRIIVTNPGIKAWEARTTNVRLEYYFGGVGLFSVGAFSRDFHNAFAGSVIPATSEFLAVYGLDAATYQNYEVSTQSNVQGVVRMTGADFSYKQALTFLPHWARGLQVFANGSVQRATGPSLGSFAGSNYVPRSGSCGVSLTRERFNVRTNWNYRARSRGALVTGRGLEEGTYNWILPRLYIDVQGEYYFRKNFAVFANLRNVGAVMQDTEIAGPSTPAVARLRTRLDNGSLWTFGVKGSF